eukprot:2817613-Lingulodinium_polyedra.AAC.1
MAVDGTTARGMADPRATMLRTENVHNMAARGSAVAHMAVISLAELRTPALRTAWLCFARHCTCVAAQNKTARATHGN